jgi:molecular chaperone GrpE
MGWIIAALMSFVAAIALGVVWRKYRRDVQRLRQSRDEKIRELGSEHRRRLDRLRREHDRELASAHHPLIRDLLPALDSLDEALSFVDGDNGESEGEEQSVENGLGDGLKLARSAVDEVLKRHGIEPISANPGDSFDPEVHEAIARNETSDFEPGTITRQFRSGYRHGERVLRSAMVEVAAAQDDFDSSSSSSSSPAEADDSAEEGLEASEATEPESPKVSDDPSRR